LLQLKKGNLSVTHTICSECKITYHAGKSLWVRRKVEGKWEGQALDGWMDGVKRDAGRMGIRNWRTKTMGREGWRLMIESFKPLHGL
jgi:hypothetical protein